MPWRVPGPCLGMKATACIEALRLTCRRSRSPNRRPRSAPPGCSHGHACRSDPGRGCGGDGQRHVAKLAGPEPGTTSRLEPGRLLSLESVVAVASIPASGTEPFAVARGRWPPRPVAIDHQAVPAGVQRCLPGALERQAGTAAGRHGTGPPALMPGVSLLRRRLPSVPPPPALPGCGYAGKKRGGSPDQG